jgi:hypothetical protein
MPSTSKVHLGQSRPPCPTQTQRYITRNSEYLLRGGICLEVRKCGTSEVLRGHSAVEKRLIARVRWRRGGGQEVVVDGAPEIGDSLLLGQAGHEILTSVVRRIDALASEEGPHE